MHVFNVSIYELIIRRYLNFVHSSHIQGLTVKKRQRKQSGMWILPLFIKVSFQKVLQTNYLASTMRKISLQEG
jgi:hypothetical protein